jgi:hypothetical protein
MEGGVGDGLQGGASDGVTITSVMSSIVGGGVIRTILGSDSFLYFPVIISISVELRGSSLLDLSENFFCIFVFLFTNFRRFISFILTFF